jgi:starch phosphorylase
MSSCTGRETIMKHADPAPPDGGRDTERAVAELAERLPESLRPLAWLAFNYRWSWTPGGAGVWRDIDASLWERTQGNPRAMIEMVVPHRLEQLADDPGYITRVRELAALVEADLRRSPAAGIVPDRPVAYFCSEFGVHSSLPLYGGGLGVLAGDVLKAASDLAVPMVGVGLLYRQGYFHQRLDMSGWQHEWWTTTDFERLPAVLVIGPDGEPLTVVVTMRERSVRIQIWRIDVGRVRLYLLDTDRKDNHPIDRWITARLYIGDRHTRLTQYGVLGVGGVRALAALGIDPCLVHLNEGHAAMASFERLRVLLEAGHSREEALAAVREATVFTTHTPVAAGNEWYTLDEVEPVLGQLREGLDKHRTFFYGLSRVKADDKSPAIAITPLALRTSRASIGVSRRHGEVSRAMWQPLWPGRDAHEVPIGHVTNGVHTATWMAEAMQALLDRHLGASWRTRLADADGWEGIAAIPDRELWAVRKALRQQLVQYTREQSIRVRLARGESPDYVDAAARVFDPDVLTIGFARRVATYKRLYLLTRQLDRGLALLAHSRRPIQVIIAGKAHPQDEDAKRTLQGVLELRRAPHVASRIAFLDDYDLDMATRLVAGADLWINVPRPPLEASGTSGMKVALNGGLNLSVLDGWWLEGYDGETGWGIRSPEDGAAAQDDHDATALYDLLEHEIIPLFYERDVDGLPRQWISRIKASMQRLIPRFSAERMVGDYVNALYTGGDTHLFGLHEQL